MFQGKWKARKGEVVAVKKCTIAGTRENPDIPREVQILSSVPEHPNIISFYAIAFNYPDMFIVTEFAEKYGGPNGPSTTVFGKLPFPSNFHFHRNSTSIELLLPWSFHFHDLAFHCFVRHALTTMCSAHAQFKSNGSVTAPAAQIVLVGDVHRIQIRLTLVDLPGHLCIFLL